MGRVLPGNRYYRTGYRAYGYRTGYGYPYRWGYGYRYGYGYVGAGYGYAPYPRVYGPAAYWVRRPYWRAYRRAYWRRRFIP